VTISENCPKNNWVLRKSPLGTVFHLSCSPPKHEICRSQFPYCTKGIAFLYIPRPARRDMPCGLHVLFRTKSDCSRDCIGCPADTDPMSPADRNFIIYDEVLSSGEKRQPASVPVFSEGSLSVFLPSRTKRITANGFCRDSFGPASFRPLLCFGSLTVTRLLVSSTASTLLVARFPSRCLFTDLAAPQPSCPGPHSAGSLNTDHPNIYPKGVRNPGADIRQDWRTFPPSCR